MHAEALGKEPRRKRRDDAVEVRRADAERDQREHVRAAVDDRRPARSKNGQPAQSTTGVAQHQADPVRHAHVEPSAQAHARAPCRPSRARTPAAPEHAAIQNRRVMSTSSGFGPSSSVTVRGSSAMPQIGHAPGASRTISGCIGHVYSTRVAGGVASAGSSAMPHFGHGPGWSCSTSGSIGQTYLGTRRRLGGRA